MSVSGAYDDGFEDEGVVPARTGALVCWPVEFSCQENPVPKTHCSALYWPEVEASKDDLLFAMRRAKIDRFYRIADVTAIDAFGESSDYPVLRIQSNVDGVIWSHSLEGTVSTLKTAVWDLDAPDNRFSYQPHVSVDVKTLVNPPKRLILRPLELWYRDDESVIV